MSNRLLFKKLLYSQVTATIGELFLTIALATLAVQITGSGIAAAWLISINAVATFTIGFTAGPLIDKNSRKKVMLISDVARAILLIPFFFLTKETFWVAYILTFLLACFNSLFHPARESYIQTLFKGEERLDIITTVQSSLSIVSLLVPSIAGLLISLIDIKIAFVINILTFIISALLILQIKSDPKNDIKEHKNFLDTALSGWKYILTNKRLVNLNITRVLLTSGIAIFSVVSYQLLVDTSKILKDDISFITFPLLLGIVSSLQGIGSLTAGLTIKKHKKYLADKQQLLMVIAGIIFATGYAVWAIGSIYVILIGSYFIGLALVIGRTGIISYGQEVADPEFMGRAITAGDAMARISHILAMGLASSLLLVTNSRIILIISILFSISISLLNINRKEKKIHDQSFNKTS
ncbi:MFS transporter [Fictibacillus sp. B-59209]|uniref:MFS transporter n=1 Tax=Fictibacillus sp. B-59209 TaxID=3024873 RepID=UPI002E2515B3|nr:MFS transporter [Fictibacillus sp. B-59209]